jgi:phosphoribosylaminoimidazole-succinocarboxamide synthase
MARRKLIYEGKAKILYEGPEPGTIVQYFKDDATAGNAAKHAVVEGKGVLNNRLSEFFMAGLNGIGVPTHFIRRLNMREQLVHAVEIIPLEVVVRNVAAGSLSERLGIEEGTPLPRPIIEFYFKDDALGDPLVTEEHILAFNWASQQDLDDMVALALRVNDFLSGVMLGAGIRLIDFKIEVGRVWDGDFQRLLVADEISPDSCRLWDIERLLARRIWEESTAAGGGERSWSMTVGISHIPAADPWRRSRRRFGVAWFPSSSPRWSAADRPASPLPGGHRDPATTPGIGAPTWFGLAGSAFGCALASAATAVGHPDHPGLAVQFEEHPHIARIEVSPTACRRISSVLPGSISADDLLARLHAVEEGAWSAACGPGRTSGAAWHIVEEDLGIHQIAHQVLVIDGEALKLLRHLGAWPPDRPAPCRPRGASSRCLVLQHLLLDARAETRPAAGPDRRASCRRRIGEGDIDWRGPRPPARLSPWLTIISAMSPTTLEDGVTFTISPNIWFTSA